MVTSLSTYKLMSLEYTVYSKGPSEVPWYTPIGFLIVLEVT